MRVGLGYDSHRFGADRPLVLAGQTIAAAPGLIAHSDGDAVAHAVIDALLGAGALGDIGTRFPDTDPAWKDADSMALLRAVRGLLADAGLRPVHIDATIILERPKLAAYKEAMARALADAVGLEAGAVSVKAKTNEGMGFVGRGEGIAVMAVATVAPA